MCKKGVEGPESNALAGGLKGQWLMSVLMRAHALIRGWDVTPHGLSLWGWQGWGKGKRLGPGEVAASLAAGGQAAAPLPAAS